MACSRTPGPYCQEEKPIWIDGGTSSLIKSPSPAPRLAPLTTESAVSRRPLYHQDGDHLPLPGQTGVTEIPLSGKIPVALGLGAKVRIPVPGTNGLAIELTGRGWAPKGGSTSSLFIQDVAGKRQLRLDYGFNKNSSMVEWHWNQKGVADTFGITNHTSASSAEQALGTAARYYKFAGRALLIAGVLIDGYSIVVASKPLRRTIQVVSAWAAATAGCELVGSGMALAGTAIAPGPGTAAGGLLGCAVGGFIGYATAETTAGYLYDWAEGTIFTNLEPADEGTFDGAGASG